MSTTAITAATTMKKSTNTNENQKTKSSNKRPRAPIACFRCHHKKVRCDGIHPNCTRCLSTGVLCAYPSSRRSRTTQPTNVDPFIDNLSHLEARIRRIESDLANQRSMVHSIVNSPISDDNNNNELESKMIKTELEVQDSRSILAQLRLRGEQRISRSKRAATANANVATASMSASTNANTTSVNPSLSLPLTKEEKTKNKQLNAKSISNRTTPKSNKPKQVQSHRPNASSITKSDSNINAATTATTTTTTNTNIITAPSSSFYFQDMMLNNNADLNCYDNLPPGHGMDWTLFDQQDNNAEMHQQSAAAAAIMSSSSSSSSSLFPPNASTITTLSEHNPMMMFHHQQQQQDQMMMEKSPLSSTRSSSLASNLGEYPVILQPSNSTNSVNSNVTALSSTTSCTSMSSAACDNIFNFNMDDMMLPHHSGQQGILYNYTIDTNVLFTYFYL